MQTPRSSQPLLHAVSNLLGHRKRAAKMRQAKGHGGHSQGREGDAEEEEEEGWGGEGEAEEAEDAGPQQQEAERQQRRRRRRRKADHVQQDRLGAQLQQDQQPRQPQPKMQGKQAEQAEAHRVQDNKITKQQQQQPQAAALVQERPPPPPPHPLQPTIGGNRMRKLQYWKNRRIFKRSKADVARPQAASVLVQFPSVDEWIAR
jgi:hypothetical protein